jgi:hypothetical protein
MTEIAIRAGFRRRPLWASSTFNLENSKSDSIDNHLVPGINPSSTAAVHAPLRCRTFQILMATQRVSHYFLIL